MPGILSQKFFLKSNGSLRSLGIAVAVLLGVVALQLIAILLLNGGRLVFILDDPYIHLALAENLLKGHYGVNLGEFSSPSSSLLWPFLIAPFSRSSFSSYGILILNTLCAAGTVCVFWRVLRPSFSRESSPGSPQEAGANARIQTFFVWTLIALLFAMNLFGLIYIGMEHSLQILLSSLIVMGLIHETEHKSAPAWIFAALIVAPWVRFECLALSVPALILLYFRGYRAKSFLSAALLLAGITAFGLFLKHLGLDPIPFSITAKSPFLNSGRGAMALYDVLRTNLATSKGMLLSLGMLFLLYQTFAGNRTRRERVLAGTLACSIVLHLCVGQFGGRYEVYIVTTTLLGVLYLNKKFFYDIPLRVGLYPAGFLLLLTLVLLFSSYLEETLTLPIASNNIYQQQYQMHRFAVEYYRKPVAVNDLGLVAYRNDNYVLDFCGLASKEALENIKKNALPYDWMPALTKKRGVQLAMIYDDWWFSQTPDGRYESPPGWHKLGELNLGRVKISPARSNVSFYALTPAAAAEAEPMLVAFRKTLPKGAVFELADNNDSAH
jgi:hypothetical protein